MLDILITAWDFEVMDDWRDSGPRSVLLLLDNVASVWAFLLVSVVPETLIAFMLHANDRLRGSIKDGSRYVRGSACLHG